jgi:hypothetical protein
MLELTFGRPGKDQHIAAIQDLALRDFVFTADDVNILTACYSDETKVQCVPFKTYLMANRTC